MMTFPLFPLLSTAEMSGQCVYNTRAPRNGRNMIQLDFEPEPRTHWDTSDSTGYHNSRNVADCSPLSPYLRHARWMTAAALFFLRNSSFLLRSLWIICRRCSTGRR